MSEPRIVDVVFSRSDLHAWRRSGVAWAISAVLGLASLVGIRLIRGPECECGVRVIPGGEKKELSIDVPAPVAPPAPIQKDEPPPQRELEQTATKQAAAAKQAPPTFAQAASIVAREAAPNEPLDLTGEAFVTGSGTVYSGGLTTSSGASSAAVRVAAAPQKPSPPAGPRPSSKSSQSRPVGLPDPSWTCPWPAGAESEAFDEQSAFVQVTVRQDGTVQSAVVLMDPGFGFGDAARRCALSAHFAPALNTEGAPMHAVSPPIRVRFVR